MPSIENGVETTKHIPQSCITLLSLFCEPTQQQSVFNAENSVWVEADNIGTGKAEMKPKQEKKVETNAGLSSISVFRGTRMNQQRSPIFKRSFQGYRVEKKYTKKFTKHSENWFICPPMTLPSPIASATPLKPSKPFVLSSGSYTNAKSDVINAHPNKSVGLLKSSFGSLDDQASRNDIETGFNTKNSAKADSNNHIDCSVPNSSSDLNRGEPFDRNVLLMKDLARFGFIPSTNGQILAVLNPDDFQLSIDGRWLIKTDIETLFKNGQLKELDHKKEDIHTSPRVNDAKAQRMEGNKDMEAASGEDNQNYKAEKSAQTEALMELGTPAVFEIPKVEMELVQDLKPDCSKVSEKNTTFEDLNNAKTETYLVSSSFQSVSLGPNANKNQSSLCEANVSDQLPNPVVSEGSVNAIEIMNLDFETGQPQNSNIHEHNTTTQLLTIKQRCSMGNEMISTFKKELRSAKHDVDLLAGYTDVLNPHQLQQVKDTCHQRLADITKTSKKAVSDAKQYQTVIASQTEKMSLLSYETPRLAKKQTLLLADTNKIINKFGKSKATKKYVYERVKARIESMKRGPVNVNENSIVNQDAETSTDMSEREFNELLSDFSKKLKRVAKMYSNNTAQGFAERGLFEQPELGSSNEIGSNRHPEYINKMSAVNGLRNTSTSNEEFTTVPRTDMNICNKFQEDDYSYCHTLDEYVKDYKHNCLYSRLGDSQFSSYHTQSAPLSFGSKPLVTVSPKHSGEMFPSPKAKVGEQMNILDSDTRAGKYHGVGGRHVVDPILSCY